SQSGGTDGSGSGASAPASGGASTVGGSGGSVGSASGGTSPDSSGGAPNTGGAGAATSEPSEGLAGFLGTRQPKVTFFHGVFGATASIVLDPQLESPAADAACAWTFAGDCGFRTGCEEQPRSGLDAGEVSLSSPDVAGSFSSSFTEGAYPPDHGNFETRLSGGEALHLVASGGAGLGSFAIDT